MSDRGRSRPSLSGEPNPGLDPRTLGSWPELKADTSPMEPPRWPNFLHFYILMTHFSTDKLKKQCHLQLHQKKSRNKSNQEWERHSTLNTWQKRKEKHVCRGGQNVWVKDLEGDTNKWKHTPCSLTGRVNYVNMSIVPKAIDRCDEIPIWIPVALFEEIENSPQTCMESQKTPNTQSNLEKERCSQHTPGFQARLQSCCHQNRMVLA